MTISNNLLPVHTESSIQSEKHSAQQRLSAAEAIANQLDTPDWRQIATDGIYRYGYIVALRTQALMWKIRATNREGFPTCYYSEPTKTLFVQTYALGQLDSVHLRGKIQNEQCSQINLDMICNCSFLQVGGCLSALGEQWADWRLISLEIAGEGGF